MRNSKQAFTAEDLRGLGKAFARDFAKDVQRRGKSIQFLKKGELEAIWCRSVDAAVDEAVRIVEGGK